jgi:hypothetical protein
MYQVASVALDLGGRDADHGDNHMIGDFLALGALCINDIADGRRSVFHDLSFIQRGWYMFMYDTAFKLDGGHGPSCHHILQDPEPPRTECLPVSAIQTEP